MKIHVKGVRGLFMNILLNIDEVKWNQTKSLLLGQLIFNLLNMTCIGSHDLMTESHTQRKAAGTGDLENAFTNQFMDILLNTPWRSVIKPKEELVN